MQAPMKRSPMKHYYYYQSKYTLKQEILSKRKWTFYNYKGVNQFFIKI